jgi:fatty acid synthase subunit beta, fungi type
MIFYPNDTFILPKTFGFVLILLSNAKFFVFLPILTLNMGDTYTPNDSSEWGSSAASISSPQAMIPSAASTRLIEISYGVISHSLPIPTFLHYYAKRSTDKYSVTLNGEEDAPPLSLTELLARYLLFVVKDESSWVENSSDAHVQYVSLLLDRFDSVCLQREDVHTVAAALPGEAKQRQLVVKAWYTARAFTHRPVEDHGSALFESAATKDGAKLYAIFGGQGNTEDYFSELRELYSTYPAFVEPLLAVANETLQPLLRKANVTIFGQFSHGLNITQWLQQPQSTPSPQYLLSAPVSFPIIGLIQFANYAVMCHVLGRQPGQVVESFKGMAGHSQGVVVAATIATATDWDSFEDALQVALTILFFIGTAGQEVSPWSSVSSKIAKESVDNGEGQPSPMLNVSNFKRQQLQRHIDSINEHLEPELRITLALVNGPSNLVVSGPSPSLYALNVKIRQMKAPIGLDQGRTPFSARKPELLNRFLPMSVAFHNPHLEEAYDLAMKDIALEDIVISSKDLRTAVYHTKTGKDLASSSSNNIVGDLVRMITCDQVEWPKATEFPGATHILDFGPGGASGVGVLTNRNKEGTGVRVILAGAVEGMSTEIGYRPEIFDRNASSLKWGPLWSRDHASKLIRSANGELVIENAMTKLLGRPPVMVAGMTPCTVHWDFVSATINAGYHIELAGGGYINDKSMSAAIYKIHETIPVGQGICLNLIYAKPSAIRWQIPMTQRLRSEGIPIDGLTFGAGVPSVDVANEYIESLGLRYLGLKPGSVNSIEATLAIARANPTFPIVLQWTAGRGGGHHSYEDFHEPVLKMYAKMRRCKNIVLIAGSGFGSADDTYPYISGEWSTHFGYPPMPFDGCLLGSRMMVAKEAHTSKPGKQAIINAKGVEPKDWDKTYKGAAGGVITVISEMGEPIHKLATRGVLLWKELDDTIFSISDRAKRVEALQSKKAYIIKRLNDDFQKVWFGRNDAGVVDLEDMTYAEIVQRMVELLYVKSEKRWIDPSFIRLTVDFIRRMQERLGPKQTPGSFPTDFGLSEPFNALTGVFKAYPRAKTQLVTFDDAKYFVLLCQRPGQKPVTFVPALDEHFEIWFKKDSLWQSEDIAAVVDEDIGRTCILQGPVAVRYCQIVDEPVCAILGSIKNGHVERILQDRYHGNRDEVPLATAVQDSPARAAIMHCGIVEEANQTTYQIPHTLSIDECPDHDAWLELLAGRPGTWRHALFTSEHIFQDRKLQPNPVRRILAPVQGLSVEVAFPDEPKQTTITVTEELPEKSPVYRNTINIRGGPEIVVTLTAYETAEGSPIPLNFVFTYHPEAVIAPIREVMSDRNDRLRKFYYSLWFGKRQSLKPPTVSPTRRSRIPHVSPLKSSAGTNLFTPPQRSSRSRSPQPPNTQPLNTTFHPVGAGELLTPTELRATDKYADSPSKASFHGEAVTISTPTIQDFNLSLGGSNKRISSRSDKTMAPLDFAIVVGWEAMMKAIFPRVIDGEFLKLVHLSNKFQVIGNSAPLSSRDRIESSAEILSIMNRDSGRVVEVGAVIKRESVPILELVSQFLFRGTYDSFDKCFQKKVEEPMQVRLASSVDVAVLKSKPWIHFDDPDIDLEGQGLIFQLQTLIRYDGATTYRSVETFGIVLIQLPNREHMQIARVQYKAGLSSNLPVMEYLQRHGTLVTETHNLENPQPLGEQDSLRFTTPTTNHAYARSSGDFNPIHVSRVFAAYAGLPGTITHGMFTSAAVRQTVEKAVGSGKDVRMKSYQCSFDGMVLPGDTFEVEVNHVAMKNGIRKLKFQACNIATHEKVLSGEAEVEQPLTAYVFTGQGSQQPGMGMDLYESSEEARAVWDRADAFFAETYGKFTRLILVFYAFIYSQP